MIDQYFKVNALPNYSIPTHCHISAGDKGNKLYFHVLKGMDELTETVSSAYFNGTKPDGTGWEYQATTETKDGVKYYVLTITEQMTAQDGTTIMELRLRGTNADIGTANIYLEVEKRALDPDKVISSNDFQHAVDEVIDQRIGDIIQGGKNAIAQHLADVEDFKNETTANVQKISDDLNAEMAEFKTTTTNRVNNLSDAITTEMGEFEARVNKKQADHETSVAEALGAQQSAMNDRQTQHERDVKARQDAFEAGINSTVETLEDIVDKNDRLYKQTSALAQSAYNMASEAGDTANDSLDKVNQNRLEVEELDTKVNGKVDGAYVEDGYLYLTSDNEVVAGPLGPFSGTGGGGGSAGNNAVLTVANTSGWLSKTIGSATDLSISFAWSSIEGDIPTGNGIATISVNSVIKGTIDVAQGDITLNIKKYISTGSNTLKLTVSDVYGNSRSINYRINVVNVSITSTFDTATPFEGPIVFPYTPTGDIEKTVNFELDGEIIGTQKVVASGRQQTYIIPEQEYGAHKLRVWFTCEIAGQEMQSNILSYSFIALGVGNAPIIVSDFEDTEIPKYTNIAITYRVYVPGALTAPVELKVNGETISEITVNRNQQIWSYRATEEGPLQLSIVSGESELTFDLTITQSEVTAEAETNDLEFYLSSQGRSNNEQNPLTWGYNNINATFSGFNLITDGWQPDADGNTAMRIAGGAAIDIPFKPFAQNFNTTGKTIEVEFATRDVLNYDSVILSCMNEGRGIEITAQKATFRSEQSEVVTQFKENEHVRLSFVVEKRVENRLVYIYINGIMSGVVQYPTNDNFQQATPAGIQIRSTGCTVDLYTLRVYSNDLTRYQIVDNFIADTQNVEEMLNRFNRNNIFDAYGNIVIEKLPRELPYLILEGPETPQYKGDKKTMKGTYTNPGEASKNFSFQGAEVDVQGTSSQYYARKNYKIKFKKGFTLADGTEASKYAMRSDSIPVSTFTFKADVASSEGANNVELVRLYNNANPYKTAPQKEDANIRQGIDGFPIVIFWNDGDNTTFIGKYNFNNDKGTPEVFGFTEGDESWETLNNTSDLVLFKSDDFSRWAEDFEGRYPDGNTNIDNLKELATWLKSTDRTQATGQNGDTSEARLAKFKAEAADHLALEACEFYYLFTELFLMVDSRAKNSFPSFFGEKKWFSLPYDFDTAIGINNEGALAFGYNLEDTDKTEGGADVFNGQNSVLWTNLRDAFGDEIKAMYQTLRSKGKLSYDIIETAFEEHQEKWSEAIFNEDAWFKYLQPLVEKNDSSYLTMLQGSKAEQRKWWLYNRFRYLDSKYNAGDAQSDVITLRGYAKSNVSLTPYADIYASVKYGSVMTQVRANRNQEYTLECPLDNVNDTEIYIYSASQLAALGDVSGLKVGYADFSNATKLQTLKVGDAASGYSNGNLTELYLGNNTLLKTLDVRNCPNLAMPVDLSGCTNLEEAYFDGTGLTGLQLADGGKIKKLHLPASMTNLTLRNQTQLTDFVLAGTDNLTTVDLENAPSMIDTLALIKKMKPGARVRMVGIDWNVGNGRAFLDFLDTLTGIDENGYNTALPVLSGKIYFTGATTSILNEFKQKYPYCTYTHDTIKIQYTWYDDDGTTVLKTQSVSAGSSMTKPSNPSKSTTGTIYSSISFQGWALSKDGEVLTSTEVSNLCSSTKVTEDRNFYAVYTYVVKTYTVKFYSYSGTSTVLKSVTVPHGGNALDYYSDIPVRWHYKFLGWSPDPTNITENISIYGTWEEITISNTEITDSWQDISAACSDGSYLTKYKLGQYKMLDLGSLGNMKMQIVAMDTDDLADGSGKAPITWMSQNLTQQTFRYSEEASPFYLQKYGFFIDEGSDNKVTSNTFSPINLGPATYTGFKYTPSKDTIRFKLTDKKNNGTASSSDHVGIRIFPTKTATGSDYAYEYTDKHQNDEVKSDEITANKLVMNKTGTNGWVYSAYLFKVTGTAGSNYSINLAVDVTNAPGNSDKVMFNDKDGKSIKSVSFKANTSASFERTIAEDGTDYVYFFFIGTYSIGSCTVELNLSEGQQSTIRRAVDYIGNDTVEVATIPGIEKYITLENAQQKRAFELEFDDPAFKDAQRVRGQIYCGAYPTPGKWSASLIRTALNDASVLSTIAGLGVNIKTVSKETSVETDCTEVNDPKWSLRYFCTGVVKETTSDKLFLPSLGEIGSKTNPYGNVVYDNTSRVRDSKAYYLRDFAFTTIGNNSAQGTGVSKVNASGATTYRSIRSTSGNGNESDSTTPNSLTNFELLNVPICFCT